MNYLSLYEVFNTCIVYFEYFLSAEGRPILCSCIGRKDHVNPKLEELKEIIFRLYRDKPESRVIVLIKTRDLVQAIENWMKETDGLSCLNPVKFVGTQASEEKGGKHLAILPYVLPFLAHLAKGNVGCCHHFIHRPSVNFSHFNLLL